MGAASKHIAKYTNGYQRLFPEAAILLIQSSLSGMFLGCDLDPAFEVIQSYIQDSQADSKKDVKRLIVLHAFSNGGASNAIWLAKQLLQTHDELPFDSLILDSCPGRAKLASGTRAVTLSLPNQYLVRVVGWYVVCAALFTYMLVFNALSIEDDITRLRRSLNDAKLFSQKLPKPYIHSKADLMVDSRHVHEHAEEARQRGYATVREELFESAPHCALLNEDSERYWTNVKAHVMSDDGQLQKEL